MNLDLSNIAVGQVYGSYRELCTALSLKPTTGEAKQKQLRDLSKYIKYRREKNKFYIDEILNYPDELDELLDNTSKSPYVKLIETLIVARLVGTQAISIEYTYKRLFQELCMASSNYNTIYNKGSYEQFCDNVAQVSKEVYLDFRRSSYSENKKKIKTALDSMVNRGLIDYEEERYVCYEDDSGKEIHMKPSEKEMALYLAIVQDLLKKYECDSIDDVKAKHLSKKFDEDLVDAMRNNLNWKYTYKKIKIVNGISDSMYALDKTRQKFIQEARDNKVKICEEELNKAIKKMIDRVGEKQHDNAVRKLEEWERGDEEWGMQNVEMPYGLYSVLYRTKEDYLPSWNVLSEYFIVGDEEAAKDRGRKIDRREEDEEIKYVY